MELIHISARKLKVMLSLKDMEDLRLYPGLDCSDSVSRKAIRHVLNEVMQRTGFDTTGDGVFIQFFSSPKGGCEMFITKESTIKNEDSEQDESKSIDYELENNSYYEDSDIHTSDQKTNPTAHQNTYYPSLRNDHSRLAFSFEKLSYLTDVCRRLSESGFSEESYAYTDESGNFYLILCNIGISAYARLDKLTFILEYGKRENTDTLLMYICEHGKTICEHNAVQTLANM